ncbi:hypothetical protein [Paucibacter sp. B51]|uniref:hypothetical protein n=1 Tax=Paucibacter sp. B51 TaxID=2993315 RepID=UPI0022EBE4D2|nr:hypothetical protein [Paucibacter sp. B51]
MATSPASELQAGEFTGRAEFQQALRLAIEQACAQGCTELGAFDPDFSVWPWSEAGLLDLLSDWVRAAPASRRMHLLAPQFDGVRRAHPRFVAWRGRYGHAVQARAFEPEAMAAVGPGGPAALFWARSPTTQITLRLMSTRNWRGSVSFEASEFVRWKDWFDVIAQHSYESFASTTLGL